MKSKRGVADPITLVLIAGFAAGVFAGTWKPFLGLKKGPQTKQLEAAQIALVDAEKKAKEAQDEADRAVLAEREKMGAQLRSAQGDALGVSTALEKVKDSPEIRVARAFAGRVNMKLAVAIGALPHEQQEQMIALVDGLVAENAQAKEKLLQMDAEFKAITAQRDAIASQIPKLEEEARKAAQNAQERASEVTAKTNEVAKWADKARASELEAGSLGTAFWRVVYLLGFLACGWVFLAFIVPLFLKTMRPSPIKTVLRDVTGFASGGMHFLDARKKLSAVKGGA